MIKSANICFSGYAGLSIPNATPTQSRQQQSHLNRKNSNEPNSPNSHRSNNTFQSHQLATSQVS